MAIARLGPNDWQHIFPYILHSPRRIFLDTDDNPPAFGNHVKLKWCPEFRLIAALQPFPDVRGHALQYFFGSNEFVYTMRLSNDGIEEFSAYLETLQSIVGDAVKKMPMLDLNIIREPSGILCASGLTTWAALFAKDFGSLSTEITIRSGNRLDSKTKSPYMILCMIVETVREGGPWQDLAKDDTVGV